MDFYVFAMHTFSVFGFFIIFFSLYLLFNVPTKLSRFTRFAIHGHDISSALAQLYMTLGTIPNLVLPCASLYMSGLFTYFGVLSSLDQAWSQIWVNAISGSFTILLTINRTFAVSMKFNKWRKHILSLFFGQLFLQIVCIPLVGLTMTDRNVRARKICQKMIKSAYPIEMYTMRGINFVTNEDFGLLVALAYMTLVTLLYSIVCGLCGVVLISSIRTQGRSSQSPQFLANQRRITLGVLYYLCLMVIGLGVPFITVSSCIYFSLGTPAVAKYACISVCIYPIFGPYHVLMSNMDYRRKVHSLIKRAPKIKNQTRTLSTTF